MLSDLVIDIGNVVLTDFGVGVITNIVSHDDKTHFIKVRLWRVPGSSIASSAVAFLRTDSIIKNLPCAPGMVTTISSSCDHSSFPEKDLSDGKQEVLVHSYSAASDVYNVSTIMLQTSITEENESNNTSSGDFQALDKLRMLGSGSTSFTEDEPSEGPTKLISMKPIDLDPATSAKFYPLIEDLMKRGDQAMSMTSSLVTRNKSTISSLVSKSTHLIGQTTENTTGVLSQENMDAVSSKIKSVSKDAEGQILQVYTMMRDEELTTLFQNGRERLRQLVDDELPNATKIALEKSGIQIVDYVGGDIGNNSDPLALSRSVMNVSRQKALDALDNLLSENTDYTDVTQIKEEALTEFTSMFDSLAKAAQSDRTLSGIFDNISVRTNEWQEATGKLKATKSASLFLESTQRLQARAATIISNYSNITGKELGSFKEAGLNMTKAFTEGDAAVARLKSIELGDAVRKRLVREIEIRSGSEGGLDGIIAGAMTSLSDKALNNSVISQDNVQHLLSSLQKNAESSTQQAHETLIALLSRQSQFRDMALNRIERVLMSLESQFEGDITAEEIAKIARGDGGTSALFEPIARKAAKEIEKQLDNVESKLSDQDETSLAVLSRTRKIISGELTVDNLLDEAVSILNDEKIVAYGEKLVKHGESLLDAIENIESGAVSNNSKLGDVMKVVEKAGITKDSVMKHVEKLDINKLMDTAETAVTDEKARREMLSSAADVALDFLLRILPSMPVPPFDGVKDGLVYHLSNLSMEGFKVRKEDIIIEIAGIRASQAKSTQANNADADTSNMSPNNFDFYSSELIEAWDVPTEPVQDMAIEEPQEPKEVKATELLIIDVRNISAILENALWSFEQTYLPYLKGKGAASVNLSNGSIRLQFELRRKRVDPKKVYENDEDIEWEPVLCLHERACQIGQIDLRIHGESKITWIMNKLATYLRGPLRNYVVKTILDMLNRRSGLLLKTLNNALKNFWGIILRTSGLNMDDLEEVSESDLIDATPDPRANEVELVWREHLPLGMNLLMNDDSGLIKVTDLPRGTQARLVAEQRNLNPDIFEGATIIAVNGTRYGPDFQKELVDALRDPGRPKSVLFKLPLKEESDKMRTLIEELEGEQDFGGSVASKNTRSSDDNMTTINIVKQGPIGISFSNSVDNLYLRIDSFSDDFDGESLITESNSSVSVNDILFSINDVCVFGENGKDNALKEFGENALTRPLKLTFAKPYLKLVSFSDKNQKNTALNPADELSFEEEKTGASNRVVLKKFKGVSGIVESSGVYIGDHLIFLNGIPVGSGCRLLNAPSDEGDIRSVIATLQDVNNYPLTLSFARPQKETSRWDTPQFKLETATIIPVNVDNFEDLGCKFGCGSEAGDIILGSFQSVRGKYQKLMTNDESLGVLLGDAIESVNGQIVPSYASADMVSNAIRKSWKSGGCVDLLFCDMKLKENLLKKAQSS